VRYRPLGRTPFKISEFIYGAGGIGGLGGDPALRGRGISAQEGFVQLDGARERGVTVIDTADVYAGGDSESAVGAWLDSRRPHGVLVQTKTGGVHDRQGRDVDLSRGHIHTQLRTSIGRLGRVDLYMSHAPDPDTPLEETLEAFAGAKEAGLIQAFGVSNVDAPLLERLLRTADNADLPRPEWVQNGLNLLMRDDEAEVIPLAVAEGIAYTAFSPLAGGVLSERYLDGAAVQPGSRIAVAGDRYYRGMYTQENLVKVAALRELADERGVGVAAMALAWLRAHPGVTATVVSPSRPAQWRAVDEALLIDLDGDAFERIAALF
jgi:1-deoxyxylulose-5-phosphate synthase